MRRPPTARSVPARRRAPAVTCVGWAQLIMKNAAAPPVAASTCSIASAMLMPLGRRPSVSTVKPGTTGRPAAVAALTIPAASSG